MTDRVTFALLPTPLAIFLIVVLLVAAVGALASIVYEVGNAVLCVSRVHQEASVSGPRAKPAAIDRVDWKDDLSYIREMYGVPAVEGARVLFNRELGSIIGASGAYIVVQLDEGDRSPFILHPTWRVEYLDA